MFHKCRNIQLKQHVRMCNAYYFSQNPGWKRMRFQLVLHKTFCSNPQSHSSQWLKYRQRTKINETMLFAFPLSVFHTKFKMSELKRKLYSIITVIELKPPTSLSSVKISKFYAPINSEQKFNKMGIKNKLPIEFNLWSSWLGTGNQNHYTMFNH